MRKYSLKQVFVYYFNGLFTMGFKMLLLGLVIAILSFILLMSSALWFTGWKTHNTDKRKPLGEIVWKSTARTLDPGDLENDPINMSGFAMLAISIFGLFVSGSIISILNQGMTQKFAEISKGRTEVIEKNHVIILGWHELLFLFIKEIVNARDDNSRLTIAVMASKDKTEMEDEIKTRIIGIKRLRVVCRTGNLLQPMDLKMLNFANARAVIVLPYNNTEGDMSCIKTLLAMKNKQCGCPDDMNIVVALTNRDSIDLAVNIFPKIRCIHLGDVVGKIISHSCLHPGLSEVYRELLNFEKSEFYYTQKFSHLAGNDFGSLLSHFETSILVGIQTATGQTELNPSSDRLYQRDERLIFIAENSHSIKTRTNISHAAQEELIANREGELRSQSILVIGWNWRSNWVVRELNAFVPKPSLLTIYTDNTPNSKKEIETLIHQCARLTIDHLPISMANVGMLKEISYAQYDHIIILSCCSYENRLKADTKTISNALHLDNWLRAQNIKRNLIIELEDDRNRELITAYDIDDIVISDLYTGLYMAQVSQNPFLLDLFNELFSAEGSEIYMKPIDHYISLGSPANFYTLVESARRKNEIAIGYKLCTPSQEGCLKYKIFVNPDKSRSVEFHRDDSLIVIAKDY